MRVFPTNGGYKSRQAKAKVVQGGIYLTRRNTDDVRWQTLNEVEKETVWKAVETEWKGVVGFKAVTVVPPEGASNIRHPKQQRVIVLPDWFCAGRKQIADIVQKHDGACMDSRTLTSTKSSVVSPLQKWRPSTL